MNDCFVSLLKKTFPRRTMTRDKQRNTHISLCYNRSGTFGRLATRSTFIHIDYTDEQNEGILYRTKYAHTAILIGKQVVGRSRRGFERWAPAEVSIGWLDSGYSLDAGHVCTILLVADRCIRDFHRLLNTFVECRVSPCRRNTALILDRLVSTGNEEG